MLNPCLAPFNLQILIIKTFSYHRLLRELVRGVCEALHLTQGHLFLGVQELEMQLTEAGPLCNLGQPVLVEDGEDFGCFEAFKVSLPQSQRLLLLIAEPPIAQK